MAIAFDATSDGTSTTGTSLTWNHTCTGTNRAIIVPTLGDTGSDLISGVTYATVALTKIGVIQIPVDRFLTLWGLTSAASGVNQVAVTASSSSFILATAASYTGVLAIETANKTTNTAAAPAAGLTLTETVIVVNGWQVCIIANDGGAAISAGAGTTKRIAPAGDPSFGIFDSNAGLSSGSHALVATGSAANWGGVIVSMSPVSTATIIDENEWNALEPQTNPLLISRW